MRAKRTEAGDRKQQILDAGAKLAGKYGHKNVTRRMVAKAVGISEPLVSAYVGSTAEAQALYQRHARKLKIAMPLPGKAEKIGIKLRSAARATVVTPTRERSIREIRAIKNKGKV